MKKLAALAILTVLLITSLTLTSGAFDGNDYGGSSGGSDSGSYGGSDYSSYSSGGAPSRNWSNSSRSNSHDNKSRGFLIFAVAIVIHMIVQGWDSLSQHGTDPNAPQIRSGSTSGLHIHLPDRTAQIESIIKNYDPQFSAEEFLSFAKQVYIDIQMAWATQDLSSVRSLLDSSLYHTTTKQLQFKVAQGILYHYEDITVNQAFLTSYSRNQPDELLTIYLNARMIDWQTDKESGAILRGNKTTQWDLRYKMTFQRKQPVSDRCPYCNQLLPHASAAQDLPVDSARPAEQVHWTLSDFATIKGNTVDDGINVSSLPPAAGIVLSKSNSEGDVS